MDSVHSLHRGCEGRTLAGSPRVCNAMLRWRPLRQPPRLRGHRVPETAEGHAGVGGEAFSRVRALRRGALGRLRRAKGASACRPRVWSLRPAASGAMRYPSAPAARSLCAPPSPARPAGYRVVYPHAAANSTDPKSDTMAPSDTIMRGRSDDSAPYLLPAGACGTLVALRHTALCLAKPRRGVTA